MGEYRIQYVIRTLPNYKDTRRLNLPSIFIYLLLYRKQY